MIAHTPQFIQRSLLEMIMTNIHAYNSALSVINDTNVKQAGGVVSPSTQGAKKKPKALREKNRFGTVIVKVASLSSNRRVQERQNIFSITPRGALFHGTQCNPALVQKGMYLIVINWDSFLAMRTCSFYDNAQYS